MRGYLEGVWSEYVRVEGRRDLRRSSLDIFTIAETHSLPMELRLATISILLENLKPAHARGRGCAFQRGGWEKPNGELAGFRGLLEGMFAGEGMGSPQLDPVVKLRNEIIHLGGQPDLLLRPGEALWPVPGSGAGVPAQVLGLFRGVSALRRQGPVRSQGPAEGIRDKQANF